MAQELIELLNRGTQANTSDPFRHGNIIMLPAKGSMVVTGDLHGNMRNFERIVRYADLPANRDRHLVLQEIIHGGQQDENGGCLSFNVLFEAVRLKVAHPGQVHIVMGNHDTAFMTDAEVMKEGREMNLAMRSAMQRQFGEDAEKLDLAIRRFMFSEPLAVKCENGIWISHSLPDNRNAGKFDEAILKRKLQINDVIRGSDAYALTWGRNHSQETLDNLAERLKVKVFILGHQPQETGLAVAGDNLLILASDHNHGMLVYFDLAKSYTVDDLADRAVPLAGIC